MKPWVRIALVVGLAAVIFSPLVFQPPGTAFGEGTSFYGYPYAVIRHLVFHDHRWPFWDPYAGAGDPLLANPLAGQFYPPVWLAMVAPTPLDGLRWIVFLHLLLAAAGSYTLARWAGCSPGPAALAPIGYLLSQIVCGNFLLNGLPGELYAKAWVVWGLACLWRGLTMANRRWVMASGVCLAAQILSGTVYEVHFTLLASGITIGYWLLTEPRPWREKLARGLIAGIVVAGVGAGLSAVKLLPVLEYQPLSTRCGYALVEAERGLANMPTLAQLWHDLQQLLMIRSPTRPALYTQAYLLFSGLGVVGAWLAPPWRRAAGWLTLMAVIGIWGALGARAPIDFYAICHAWLPGFKMNQHTARFFGLTFLSVPVLAALGATWVQAHGRRWFSLRAVALATAAFVAWGLLEAGGTAWAQLASHPYGQVSPAIVGNPSDFNARLAALAQRQGRHAWRTYSVYGPVYPYTALLNGFDMLNYSNHGIKPKFHQHTEHNFQITDLENSWRLFEILNVRYLMLSREATHLHPNRSRPIHVTAEAGLYEVTSALPRAWSPTNALLLIGEDRDHDLNALEAKLLLYHPAWDSKTWVVCRSPTATLEAHTLEELAPFAAVILTHPVIRQAARAEALLAAYRAQGGQVLQMDYLDHPYPNPVTAELSLLGGINPETTFIDHPVPAKILTPASAQALQEFLSHPAPSTPRPVVVVERAEPGEWQLHVSTTRSITPVVVSETYYPGWEAQVDGHSSPLLMADGVIRGVLVRGAGDHTVTMRYCPRIIWWGVGITMLTLGGCVGYLRR